MKKIGLATFFFDDNYGTCLQAFGLQYTIEKLGYKVSLLRYHRGEESAEYKSNRWKKVFHISPIKLLWWLFNRKTIAQKKGAFLKYRLEKLHLAEDKDYYRNSDFSALASKYDALVCGSDMMWSSDFKHDWPFYYLTFGDKKRTISYAPSFGRNYLSKEEVLQCIPYINNIGYLSCREKGGVDLIKEKFNLEATHVVDPTLLLTAEEWNNTLNTDKKIIEGDYFLVYLFNGTTRHGRNKIIEQAEKITNDNVVVLSGAEGKFKKYQYDGAGPSEFVRLYRDCKFVLTDTFHGMLFAIIFKKPFIVLDKSTFGISADRLVNTLHFLGISNRYVKTNVTLDDTLLKMNYENVDKILIEEREKSINYLKYSLDNATK